MLIRAGRSYFQHEHMTKMVDANFSVADARRESVPTLTLYFHNEQHPVVLQGEDRRHALADLRRVYEDEVYARTMRSMLRVVTGDDGETDEEG